MADQPEVSKDEQIGFHKGCLDTLMKERAELAKMIGVIEQLMQMHVKALKEQGVDLQKMAEEAQKAQAAQPSAKPIDDLVK